MCNRLLPLLGCLALGCALPPRASAQPETVPPWGRELGGITPISAQEPHKEGAEPKEPAAENGAENGEGERRPLFWVESEYLFWFTRKSTVPILLTRGQTTVPRPGALDQVGTKFIYGDSIDFKDRSGARFSAGIPFGPDGMFGVEATYFFITARDVGSFNASTGNPVLASPFFDVVNNREDSSLVTYPGVLKGGIDIKSTSFIHSGEANFTATVWQCEKNRLTLLGGFRYLNLSEDLRILENVTGDVGAMQFMGRTIGISDRFAVDNAFYGGQLGAKADFRLLKFDASVYAKVAIGDSHETQTVEGQTVANTVVPINVPAGLFALSSNSGTRSRDTFAVVPEVGARLGLNVTERLSIHAGYSFLYWTNVIRPGEQIDRGLNPNLIPTSMTFGAPGGPARPAPLFQSTGYYAHGLTVGLTFRY
jgi:hypothetical protein